MNDRGSRKPQRGRTSTGRVPPPPSATGRAEAWAREKIAASAVVAVELRDGTLVRGAVADVDESHLAVRSEDAGTIRIAFRAIRAIAEE